MCGIVGVVAGKNVVPVLLDGLQRLEYRGYDSAGLAVVEVSGAIGVRREVGKLADLTVLDKDILSVEPKEMLTTQAAYAIVGGKVRYKRPK